MTEKEIERAERRIETIRNDIAGFEYLIEELIEEQEQLETQLRDRL